MIIYIENVDILDGTPLLDIKPYVPEFDAQQDCKNGWVEKKNGINTARSDGRFD